jgi:ribosome-associated translation inhibitor RaiA
MRTHLKLIHTNAEKILADYVEKRTALLLARFAPRLGAVTTRISTETSNGSGELKCGMTAEMQPFGKVTAEASDPDAFTAIDRCLGRLARHCESKAGRYQSRARSRETLRIVAA